MEENKEIERYYPNPEEGLDEEVVSKRKSEKLINEKCNSVGKSFFEIAIDNVLNVFNILLAVVSILLIVTKNNSGFVLLGILVFTILFGLFEDLSAKRAMRSLANDKVLVIRGNFRYEASINEVVLDDVVELNEKSKAFADSIVLSSTAFVDESSLTGNPSLVFKKEGDMILAGSFVVHGSIRVRVDKIGKDNYAQTVQNSAKKIKRSNMNFFKPLNKLSLFICIVSILLGLCMLVVNGLPKLISSSENFINGMTPILNAIGSIIPWGLFLVALILSIYSSYQLKKKKIQTLDVRNVSSLSKVDVVCFDKTGTLTDRTMKVNKVIGYGSNSETTITGILNDYINLIGDDNPTSNALKDYFNHPVNSKIIDKINFNSDTKYSAVTFSSGITFVLGAAENINIPNKQGLLHRIEDFTSNGYRVLVLAKASRGIKNNKVEGECDVVGMVVLQEHIRDSAVDAFAAIKENNVAIKIISGDDAKTVSELARQSGMEDYDNCISLLDLSDEQVKEAANQYSVFGRATPHQKELLIKSLKENGHKVAMVGDGINDLLAMKEADCSISLNDSEQNAKNISDVVLLDSSFEYLNDAIKEERKVYNNMQIITSLYLTKTVFAMVLAFVFLFSSMISTDVEAIYPFLINHFYVWEIVLIGFASLFLMLETNTKTIKGSFLFNSYKSSIAPSLAAIIGVIAILGMYHLQKYGVIYTGIYTVESMMAMSMLLFTVVAVFELMKAFIPFNTVKAIGFAIPTIVALACVGMGVLLSFNSQSGDESILGVNFKSLTPVNLIEVAITTTVVVTLYIVITYIIEVFKGEHLEETNKKNKRGE